jgi:hypothetical protein
VVQVHDIIVASLNRNHAIWLNYSRLRTLDTIGMVFYKRLFFHFSNIYRPSTNRSLFKLEKDYEDICREWLGGLKSEKYKSRIEKQLGKYLQSVQATGLISRFEIIAREDGKGFKLVFYPGDSFYQDYADFYIKHSKRLAQLPERSATGAHPLHLVAYFHELMGHSHNNYTAKEREQAAELIKAYGAEEARAFVEHAIKEGKKTSYNMQFFGAVLDSRYRQSWSVSRTRATCGLCNGAGMIAITDEQGTRMRACTHGQTPPSGEVRADA